MLYAETNIILNGNYTSMEKKNKGGGRKAED